MPLNIGRQDQKHNLIIYGHTWMQTRDFVEDEWERICADMRKLFAHTESERGITLANGDGEGHTRPEIGPEHICVNGCGEGAHEAFTINYRRIGGNRMTKEVCNTHVKRYDVLVLAALCYLYSITASHEIIKSDASPNTWQKGLDLIKEVFPDFDDILEIPLSILESRWCAPVTDIRTKDFEFAFCYDGHAYLIETASGEAYQFPDHKSAAKFALQHPDDSFSDQWRPSIFSVISTYTNSRNRPWRTPEIAAKQSAILSEAFASFKKTHPERFIQPPKLILPGHPVQKRVTTFLDLTGDKYYKLREKTRNHVISPTKKTQRDYAWMT